MNGASAGGKGLIVLAAGGTGGHLFPAQALAEALTARGYGTLLMTDARGMTWRERFPGEVMRIPSATVTPGRPWRVPVQVFTLLRGFLKARGFLKGAMPLAVAGFGGYPSVPPLFAAQHLRIPTLLHEQNAVMGRANRFLARRASAIATSFPKVTGLDGVLQKKATFTGNPVRAAVLAAADAPYEPPEEADAPFHLLIFGGSQGARFFSEMMPEVIAALPSAVRRHLIITQQCRPEDLDSVREAYARLEVNATLAPFFDDMPQRMAQAHLVIARAGASTVAELAVIGRPAILVPLPHALDNDQLRNARAFSEAGAGWLMRQEEITAEKLAALITRLRYAPADLRSAHAAAKTLARPDAASRLADMVEELALRV